MDGLDETPFRKGHDYVTVVSDYSTGHVLHGAFERKKKDFVEFYDSLSDSKKGQLRRFTWTWNRPTSISGARVKIASDKLHVAQLLGEAAAKVRCGEHKLLLEQGGKALAATKHVWLTKPDNMSRKQWCWFKNLRDSALKTDRKWDIKEYAMGLWFYVSQTCAENAWKTLPSWAVCFRLEPVKQAASTIRNHL